MFGLDSFDTLFILWAYFLEIVLVVHFAIRKPLYETYTRKWGWMVYALSIPGVVVSLILLIEGKSWSFWLGGFLYLIFAGYGFWIDYIKAISWRKPLRKDITIYNQYNPEHNISLKTIDNHIRKMELCHVI
jgi:hypothetical protein